jgi:putative zinc finger/helix-turn-helix YgiT family protein
MNACIQCGQATVNRIDDWHYSECGLPNVILAGVEVRQCVACRKEGVVIPNLAGLHRAIARVVADKSSRLSPHEARFLRKYLGYSGRDFAPIIGRAPETVSRWESATDPHPMDLAAERLLRLMVMTREPVEEYPLSRLAEVGKSESVPGEIRVRAKRKRWTVLASPNAAA